MDEDEDDEDEDDEDEDDEDEDDYDEDDDRAVAAESASSVRSSDSSSRALACLLSSSSMFIACARSPVQTSTVQGAPARCRATLNTL